MSEINIWYSSGENRSLSNLAERPFIYNDTSFGSVEHAYQVLKSGTFDKDTHQKYNAAGSCGRKITGKIGTKTHLDWNIKLMEKLMYRSFVANPVAAQELISTHGHTLTHNQDKGIWRIQFPRILEQVRYDLIKLT